MPRITTLGKGRNTTSNLLDLMNADQIVKTAFRANLDFQPSCYSADHYESRFWFKLLTSGDMLSGGKGEGGGGRFTL